MSSRSDRVLPDDLSNGDGATGAPAIERDPKEIRRVVLSSFLGTTIEYYDFLLYATAAGLVFSQIFFANLPSWTAALVSFATLAVGYVARPLGGIIFGHIGDTHGRKRVLVMTMLLMGVASVLIGCLPTQQQIGPWAGVLLVTLRFIQGLAIGGEWGGAVLMSAEHSTTAKKGFTASWTNSGAPAGSVLGMMLFALFSSMPQESFLAYGWRIPFWFSALLLVVGLVVRHRVAESPVFVHAQETATKTRRQAPLMDIIRHPGPVLMTMVAFSVNPAISILFPTVGLLLATQAGANRSTVLTLTSIAMFIQIFTIPAFAALSDRYGRKPIMLASILAAAAWLFLFFPAVTTGNHLTIAVAYLLGLPLIHAALIGPLPSFLAEQFSTGHRFTGLSLGYQLSNVLGGFVPLILTAIMGKQGDTGRATMFLLAVFLVSAFVLSRMPERSREALERI